MEKLQASVKKETLAAIEIRKEQAKPDQEEQEQMKIVREKQVD